jgi:uncharacterized membrane protein
MAEQTQVTRTNSHDKTLQIELFIARLLRWGVILSFVIVAIGIGGVIITGQTGYSQIRLDDVNSIVQYHLHPDFPSTLGDVFGGVLSLKPYSIIVLGLLVLIAIPVMRVTVSVFAFAWERDWLYVAITAFVLIVLILSFAIGEAGG